MHNSGVSRREIAMSYLKLERRHCEERLVRRSSTSEGGSDEAIHSFFAPRDGLLRGACHRAALCADPLARNDGFKTSCFLLFGKLNPWLRLRYSRRRG